MKSNFFLTKLMLLLCLLVGSVNGAWAADPTGTITFGTNNVKINAASVTVDDGLDNEWTITTVGTTSFTQQPTYSQVGSSNKPATSITFTTTLPAEKTITAFSAKFGGFNGTAGTVTLKVGDTSVGTGSLNAANDVTVSSTSSAKGTVLTVTVTGISKGVKCYYISYTYTDGPVKTKIATIADIDDTQLDFNATGTFTRPTITPATGATEGDDYEVEWSSADANMLTLDAKTGEYLVGDTKGTVEVTLTVEPYDDAVYEAASKTFTVTIVDPNAPGTENNPYTVAQARAAIDAGEGVTGVYAKGIVSEIVTAYNSQYGNISYNISADGLTTSDQLQAYRGKAQNGDNFTSADDIQVGDEVVVYGNLKKYNSTYEFEQDNQLVSFVRKVAKPNFTPEAGAVAAGTNVEIETVTEGAKIYYTTDGSEPTTSSSAYSDPITVNGAMTIKALAVKDGYPNSDVAIAVYTIAEPAATPTFSVAAGAYTSIQNVELATATDGATIYYTIDDSEPTTESAVYTTAIEVKESLTIKAIAAKDGMANSEVATAAYTINLPDYATLPFEFDGGKAAIDDVCGLTQVGLGSDYKSSPYLKFDHTNDYMILKIDETPGTLTFDIKGNGFSDGTFTVQTSADGETYTALKTYTDLGGTTQSETFDDLAATVRYIKWIYTTKIDGNVALGNIKLNKVNKVDVKLASSGYASFCSPLPLDLTPTENYAAWAVTATNNTEVTFTKIQGAVPAATPFILYGEGMGGQTITLPVATGATTAVAGNMLVGTLEETSVTTVNGEYTNFGLSNGEFVKLNNGTIPANKAYLPILTTNVPAAARLTIVFDEGMATGIANINRESTDNRYFNLNGQQVKTPQKGMYIVNGKKVIIK